MFSNIICNENYAALQIILHYAIIKKERRLLNMKKMRCCKFLLTVALILGGVFAISTTTMANTRATAKEISISQTVSGTLSETEPLIWYKFHVPCTGTIRFELNTQCRITSFMLTKTDYPNYIYLANQYWDKDTLGDNTITATLKKGTYYLKVNSSAELIGFNNLYGNFSYEVAFSPTNFTYGNLKYKVTGKNTVTVTGLKDKYVQSVKIPQTAKIKELNKSYKVTSISDKAFIGNSFISKIILSKSVKKIGKQAFYKCKKLKNVTFNSKAKIGKNAFKSVNKKIKYKYPRKYKFYYKVTL